jgi:TPR repeat protein
VGDESQLQVRPKDGNTSTSLSNVRSNLIARGFRDAARLIAKLSEESLDPLSGIRRLAEAGDAEAECDLWMQECLTVESGTVIDIMNALRWSLLAKRLECIGAQFNFGYLDANGTGGARDYSKVALLYRAAAEHGYGPYRKPNRQCCKNGLQERGVPRVRNSFQLAGIAGFAGR